MKNKIIFVVLLSALSLSSCGHSENKNVWTNINQAMNKTTFTTTTDDSSTDTTKETTTTFSMKVTGNTTTTSTALTTTAKMEIPQTTTVSQVTQNDFSTIAVNSILKYSAINGWNEKQSDTEVLFQNGNEQILLSAVKITDVSLDDNTVYNEVLSILGKTYAVGNTQSYGNWYATTLSKDTSSYNMYFIRSGPYVIMALSTTGETTQTAVNTLLSGLTLI